jgi:hypothetical protein
MAYKIFCNTTKLLVSEEKTLHDLLRVIGPVVERHRGVMELCALSKAIDIMVPESREAPCAHEIGEAVPCPP